jgi:CDP-diacylglycerol--glycerol-3-phosphate 3-phosphatidyltransferase
LTGGACPVDNAVAGLTMTTANKITIGRILLIPFFISQVLYYTHYGNELNRWLAIVCFAVAAISDGIDGYLARHYNQRSELGAVLDPLADKLLLVSGLVLLSFDNQPHLTQVPIWLAAIVFGRDLILGLGALVIYYFCHHVTVKPHFIGKAATVLQMAVVLWALLKWSDGWLFWLMIGAGVATGVSGLLYVVDGMRQLSASPHSSAAQQNEARGNSHASDANSAKV